MKYIIFEIPIGSELKREVPIIFPNSMVHSEVSAGFIPIVAAHKWKKPLPVSAGEYDPFTGRCSGQSETLGLRSRGREDEQIILMQDYGGGFS